MSNQKLFITGGSGYIGSVVIEYAIAEGFLVTALSRTPESDVKIKVLGATPVRGDLKSHDVLTREASKADAVINIADVISSNYAIAMDERFQINNDAIDALAAGLKGSDKPLVLTSGTVYAAPDSEGKETDESNPGWPENHSFHWVVSNGKRNMALANDGVRVCCIRLAPYVYGRGGSGIKLFMNMWAQGDAGIYVDEGKARTTSVHVEDAARLYLLLAKKGRAGEEYNASYETHVTQGELAQAICKSIGVPCNSIPYKAAVSAMGEFFATFLALENRASNKKAKEEFGWEIMADKGVLEEIECGSYVKVAEEIKQKGAA